MGLGWSLDPVLPGEYGIVDVVFNSADEKGLINKSVDVIFKNTDAKGYPLIRQLWVTGRVK